MWIKLISLLKNITFASIIKALPWIFSIILFASTFFLFKANKVLKNELVTANSNIESYQGIVAKQTDVNKVLTLDITDLKNQSDLALKKIDSVMVESKIKATSVKTVTMISQQLKTVKDTIVVFKDSTFTTTIHPNQLTKVDVSLRKDSLSVGLDIKNDQYLYVYTKKEYKNKNKNFFQRLFTLDFKKVKTVNYEIHNTNSLIQDNDVRVIESNK